MNYLNNFYPTKSLFEQIMQKHQLENIKSFTRMRGGNENSPYLINDQYVIRVTDGGEGSDDKGFSTRFDREAYLYNEIFPQKGIPAPSCYFFDSSKQQVPHPYTIISFIYGGLASEMYDDLDEASKDRIAYSLGETLNKIHSITENELGSYSSLFKLKDDWKQDLLNEYNQYLEDIKPLNFVPNDILEAVEQVGLEYQKLELGSDIPIRLVHYDFHGQHVKIDYNWITGLFDFEWSQLGDPLWDLQLLPINFSVGETFNKYEFLKGYGVNQFTANELTRLKFYAFLQGLFQIWIAKKGDFDDYEDTAQAGVEQVQRTLDYL